MILSSMMLIMISIHLPLCDDDNVNNIGNASIRIDSISNETYTTNDYDYYNKYNNDSDNV